MVIAHEFGHLIASKRAGIGVDEFGIGMGPRLFGFKYRETSYGVHLFPIGGFVNLTGLDGETDPAKIDSQKNFNLKPLRLRFSSILAGPLANFLLAFLIFYIIFLFLGVPTSLNNHIATVKPGSPAALAGLKPRDIILALDHKNIIKMEDIITEIHSWPINQPLILTIKRAEQIFEVTLLPEFNKNNKLSYIGFTPGVVFKKYGPVASFIEAVKETINVAGGVLYGFYLLFTGKIGLDGLAGPLGIAQFTGQVAQAGLAAFLQFTAFISINLGMVNLLPIPALDGGRLLFLIVEFFRGKPMDLNKEKYFNLIGFVFLIGLIILLTFTDFKRIMTKGSFLK